MLLEHLVVLIRFLFGTVMLGSETSKSSTISCDEFKEAYYHLKSASAATAPRLATPNAVVSTRSTSRVHASRGSSDAGTAAAHHP